jgi:hypothetical protein
MAENKIGQPISQDDVKKILGHEPTQTNSANRGLSPIAQLDQQLRTQEMMRRWGASYFHSLAERYYDGNLPLVGYEPEAVRDTYFTPEQLRERAAQEALIIAQQQAWRQQEQVRREEIYRAAEQAVQDYSSWGHGRDNGWDDARGWNVSPGGYRTPVTTTTLPPAMTEMQKLRQALKSPGTTACTEITTAIGNHLSRFAAENDIEFTAPIIGRGNPRDRELFIFCGVKLFELDLENTTTLSQLLVLLQNRMTGARSNTLPQATVPQVSITPQTSSKPRKGRIRT